MYGPRGDCAGGIRLPRSIGIFNTRTIIGGEGLTPRSAVRRNRMTCVRPRRACMHEFREARPVPSPAHFLGVPNR